MFLYRSRTYRDGQENGSDFHPDSIVRGVWQHFLGLLRQGRQLPGRLRRHQAWIVGGMPRTRRPGIAELMIAVSSPRDDDA
ncbi:hypothetical protein [Actinoplanes sp. NPDC020271]|uniref:hypothetical protein n=1 Tax=Actinoplanes sp. NPDC020271 TaxID=3363896 RepID=UPI0037B81311